MFPGEGVVIKPECGPGVPIFTGVHFLLALFCHVMAQRENLHWELGP